MGLGICGVEGRGGRKDVVIDQFHLRDTMNVNFDTLAAVLIIIISIWCLVMGVYPVTISLRPEAGGRSRQRRSRRLPINSPSILFSKLPLWCNSAIVNTPILTGKRTPKIFNCGSWLQGSRMNWFWPPRSLYLYRPGLVLGCTRWVDKNASGT